MPEITHHAAMSPPMVPAPITGHAAASPVFGASFFSISESRKTRRRLRECPPPSAARNCASRRWPAARIAAVFLEQLDELERARVVILAHLLGGRLAHPRGEQAAQSAAGPGARFQNGAPRICASAARPCGRPSAARAWKARVVDEADGARRAWAQQAAGSMLSIAAIAPASLIMRTVPWRPGMMPSFTSGRPMRVASSRVAMR